MGNLRSDLFGRVVADLSFDLLQLLPSSASPSNILGRGLVIHALPDDGGQPTGNAGARIAVAVVGISNRAMPPLVIPSSSSTGTNSAYASTATNAATGSSTGSGLTPRPDAASTALNAAGDKYHATATGFIVAAAAIACVVAGRV